MALCMYVFLQYIPEEYDVSYSNYGVNMNININDGKLVIYMYNVHLHITMYLHIYSTCIGPCIVFWFALQEVLT